MDRRNKVCPECGKRFHACESCGLPHTYLLYYCSDECYMKSLTFDEKKRKVEELIKESKNNIYKLDDLSYYLQEECEDELMLLLSNDEIQEEWYRDQTIDEDEFDKIIREATYKRMK